MRTSKAPSSLKLLVALSLVMALTLMIISCGDEDEATPAPTAAPAATVAARAARPNFLSMKFLPSEPGGIRNRRAATALLRFRGIEPYFAPGRFDTAQKLQYRV